MTRATRRAYGGVVEELTSSRRLSDPLQPYLDVDRSHRQGEAWVMGHMVAGLDGTAAIAGPVGALSTPPDESLFRRMRQLADVVLVGAETIRREGCSPTHLDDGARDARTAPGKLPTPPPAATGRLHFHLRRTYGSVSFGKLPTERLP